MEEIPRCQPHVNRLVALPPMSAINSYPAPLDRAGELRGDQKLLDSLWESAKILRTDNGYLASSADSLNYLDAASVEKLISSGSLKSGERYFLGIDRANNQPYFAWDTTSVDAPVTEVEELEKNEGMRTLREVGGFLDADSLQIAMHAVALSHWHRTHPRCPRCGAATVVEMGGATRRCTQDQSEHHPRTDSAVIVLVKDKDDRILLGHQPVWPEGRFSTFAGFLEPGETFEQCVEREVFEESGVKLTDIKYLGSQPWPFPASIMIAFEAIAVDSQSARPDGSEITEVKWFTRAELKSAAIDGSLLLPPTISVARKMIARWYGDGADQLPGGQSWR